MNPTVKFQALSPLAIIPSYKTEGAVGMDLSSVEAITLLPGEIKLVDTGLAIELPVGFEGQVRPRSGLAANHGVTVLNSPGTIDWDYRGQIRVILINHGKKEFSISRGDRIAQLVIKPAAQALITIAEGL